MMMATVTNYEREQQYFSSDNVYTCLVQGCSKAYVSRRGLTYHMKTHDNLHEQRSYPCELCDKAPYLSKNGLQKHQLKVHGIDHLKRLGIKETSTQDALFKRSIQSTTSTAFKCSHCHRQFQRKGNLKRHFAQEHAAFNFLAEGAADHQLNEEIPDELNCGQDSYGSGNIEDSHGHRLSHVQDSLNDCITSLNMRRGSSEVDRSIVSPLVTDSQSSICPSPVSRCDDVKSKLNTGTASVSGYSNSSSRGTSDSVPKFQQTSELVNALEFEVVIVEALIGNIRKLLLSVEQGGSFFV